MDETNIIAEPFVTELTKRFGKSLKDANFKEIAMDFVESTFYRANKSVSVNMPNLISYMAHFASI